MDTAEFLELFIKELELNSELREYYRLINNRKKYLWRRSYLEQRLEYVSMQCPPEAKKVWDVGCGYGTTSIFLALNGHSVYGNTLEFYFNKIGKRLDYWGKFGNLDKLNIEYANLFDLNVAHNQYDIIIAQDTLHHLEPINEAISIFYQSLRPDGKIIVTEENGLSIFIRIKNFSKRGFKRINEFYDDRLQKQILFGNENARSIHVWKKLFTEHGFQVPIGEIEYVRLLPHFFFNHKNHLLLREEEKIASRKMPLVRDFLFFGINFTAIHNAHKATKT
jgi:2-polyprenyl-3-methyl-5-hydroxy-6-metoxy-1,4-benzoquinol methylase